MTSWPEILQVLKATLRGWVEDNASRLAAALAYYTMLALAPVVVLILPVAGVIFGRESATHQIIGEFADLIGKVGAEAVQTVLAAPGRPLWPGRLTTIISIVVLVFAASGVFAELQNALDTIWEVKPKPGRAAVWSFVRKRFLSFAMVLGICFLLLVSLLISAGLSAARSFASDEVKSLAGMWMIAHFVLSIAIITLLFAMIFKILPDATVKWGDVWLGAALTAALFTLGKFAIGLYLGRSTFGAYYGPAGSLVILLIWVYYSSQILYFGAEFTKAWSRRCGHAVAPTVDAVPVTAEARAQAGLARKEEVEAAAVKSEALAAKSEIN